MWKRRIVLGLSLLFILFALGTLALKLLYPAPDSGNGLPSGQRIALPAPSVKGGMSLTQAIENRRSVRTYASAPMTLAELGQVLWAAQGITDLKAAKRTTPSAFGVHPLEVFVVADHVSGLSAGLYRYEPAGHRLTRLKSGKLTVELLAAVQQPTPWGAAANLVIAGRIDRTQQFSASQAERYVTLEAGHAAQNAVLQATALDLGSVTIGGISEDQSRRFLYLGKNWRVFYVVPLGHKE
ncbi:MAG: SagB/ThcOx family dehydrogenase [Solirubrobacterales bacterium]